MKTRALILGTSHTGVTLARKIISNFENKIDFLITDTKGDCPDDLKQHYAPYSDDLLLARYDKYFVLHDEDGTNVKLILFIKANYKDAKVYTVLSQTNLARKLGKHIHNVEYVNQAALASKKFVSAIYESDERPDVEPDGISFSFSRFRMDPLIRWALLFIFGVLTLSATFFHYYNSLPWVDSFYFTVTIMTTVGFGDYSLKEQDDVAKIVGTFIMVFSVVGFALAFALINDTLLRKRWELTHGISKYKGKDHVIVIGGGSVGHMVVQDLKNSGEKPVLIDKSIDGRYLKHILDLKIPFIIGDATNEKFLLDANVAECKAVIAVTQDDLTNLEIGLDTKNMHPDKRVVLRIYDQKLSKSLKDNHIIKHSYSMSYIAAEHFISRLKTEE